MIEFKPLEPEDIEVRVQQVTDKGCSLLLYKDARVDMRMLDDAVGNENWDCSYEGINGKMFCTVGILCQTESGNMAWVYKQDVGTESNMEPTKGEASDAFKRACFKWGIGRELYTAPFIWIDAGILQRHFQRDGRWRCGDRFHVKDVEIRDGRIVALSIENQSGLVVYQMPSKAPMRKRGGSGKASDETGPEKADKGRFDKIRKLKAEAVASGISEDDIEGWIKATFKGKEKKDFDAKEIMAVEAYLTGLIRDKRDAENG